MIVNPEKLQIMFIGRGKNFNCKQRLKINNTIIESNTSVKLLGVEIDNNLNFNDHISSLCKSASNKLNAISRMHKYIGKKEKQTLINTFVYSNFNYCPLVWHFSSSKSLKKIERIQERCLRIIHDNYSDNYMNLLKSTNTPSMEVKRLRTLQ